MSKPVSVVIGIDASAKKPGWAILKSGRFVAAGVVRRQDGETDYAHAYRAAEVIGTAIYEADIGLAYRIAIEVRQGPMRAFAREKLEWCIECRGRLLQSLSKQQPMRIQASREKKPNRRRRIELKYPEARKPNGQPLPEDAIDALAVADAAWTKLVLERAKG